MHRSNLQVMTDPINEAVISMYSWRRTNSNGYRVTIPANTSCAARVQIRPMLMKNSSASSQPEAGAENCEYRVCACSLGE